MPDLGDGLSFTSGWGEDQGQPLDPGDRAQWIPDVSPLPPGVHPLDPAVEIDPEVPASLQGLDSNHPVPHDSGGHTPNRGRKPWSVENDEALPVFQRSAHELAVGSIQTGQVGGPVAPNGVATIIVGRNRGRTQVKIWVPTTIVIGGVLIPNMNMLGVLVSAVEGEVQQGGGVIFNVGDSTAFDYEGPLWCAPIPGNAVGYVQFANMFNPPGGGLGGQ